HDLLKDELHAAVERVLNSGWYILGPELEAFETAFAAYHNVAYAVGVANGTDAIELALRTAGIGPGDEVITVAHTAVATICGIERSGARPVLVAITPRTRAIVPVHLYGQAADMTAIGQLAERHALLLVEDCAQAHSARWRGQ